MSAEDNKATIRRMAEAFNKRDLAFIDEGFSPHFVLHTALTPGWPQGLEGARKMFTTMLTTAPDIRLTIEDIFAEGDKVAVRWTFRGTHRVSPAGAVARPQKGRFKPKVRRDCVALRAKQRVLGRGIDGPDD